MLETDLAQIDFQLLGEEHRHRGVGPLTHFHLVHDQRDAAAAIDADETVGHEVTGRLRAGGERATERRGQAEADKEATAGGGASSKEGPAGQGTHCRRN